MTKTKKTGSSKVKSAAAAVTVPQSRDQASAYIAEIGALQRDLERLAADMNDELAAIKERHETNAQPQLDRIKALTSGVQIWCEANRDNLTQNGKVKTAALPSGEIGWRIRPPSVRVTGAEAVLDALRRASLTEFIREKQEVNKEAILASPEKVAGIHGIAITQGEDFFVTPFATELAGAAA
jgi:phage host-nuclease inhibitor protein Gam